MFPGLKEQDEQEDIESSISKQVQSQSLKEGIWDKEEILKFMVFSHFNLSILASKLQRRTLKIFRQMALFICTRTSTQCRSQNQKLIKKHKNVKRILKAYEMEIGKAKFQEACQSYSKDPKVKYKIKQKAQNTPPENRVSIFTQTQFEDESGENLTPKVKVQAQIEIIQEQPQVSYFSYNYFGAFGVPLTRNDVR